LARFAVDAPRTARDAEPGTSIAVNGVCQTVTGVAGARFGFDSVAETLKRTNLSSLRAGSEVNLEAALRLSDRISGHLVSGHVDGTCIVRARRSVGSANWDFALQVPAGLARFIRDKGSICLDGVSLTVKAAKGTMIEVTVIPFTLENTMLRSWRVGSLVNVEVDQIARYLAPGEAKRGGEA
jgi:riboflavin synthase